MPSLTDAPKKQNASSSPFFFTTVARSQEDLPAGFRRKFCQIQKNSAFLNTSIFKHLKGNKNVKRPFEGFHLGETCKENISQKLRFARKICVFRLVFGRFWSKMAAVRQQIFLGQPFFSGAGFELFCRIFGRLATVFFTNLRIPGSDVEVLLQALYGIHLGDQHLSLQPANFQPEIEEWVLGLSVSYIYVGSTTILATQG
jgi:hypothetical protein